VVEWDDGEEWEILFASLAITDILIRRAERDKPVPYNNNL